jgi:predicted dehydrogenase
MKKLKVAIIGAGQIARASHISNYQTFKNEVEIVGICDVNLQAAKEVSEQFHIPNYYSSHIEMLEKEKPDVVSVCVPNKFHCQITCDALDRGCNVLCEKPPAITVEEAEKMQQTAVKNNVLLSYGFHFRHSTGVSFLKNKILRGDFGHLYAARVQWLRRRGIPGWGNFINKEIQGGGPLIDIGAHMLDLAAYLMGYPEVEYVCASAHNKIGKRKGVGLMGAWNPDRFSVEDGLFGFIKFKNGASINLETSFALNIKEKDVRNVQLFGDKLGATLFPLEVFGEEDNQLSNTVYPFNNEEDLHYKSIANFIKACLGEEKLVVTAEQGLYVQKLICALYESSESGKPNIAGA